PHIISPKSKLPIAILAYTTEAPVRTFVYPLATYSPEYQALVWCQENKAKARFMDLPSAVFLGLMDRDDGVDVLDLAVPEQEGEKKDPTLHEIVTGAEEEEEETGEPPPVEEKKVIESVYDQVARLAG